MQLAIITARLYDVTLIIRRDPRDSELHISSNTRFGASPICQNGFIITLLPTYGLYVFLNTIGGGVFSPLSFYIRDMSESVMNPSIYMRVDGNANESMKFCCFWVPDSDMLLICDRILQNSSYIISDTWLRLTILCIESTWHTSLLCTNMSISPVMSSYDINPSRELIASLSVRQLLTYNIGPLPHFLIIHVVYSVFPEPKPDTMTIFLLINDSGSVSPHPFLSVTYLAQNCLVYVVRFRLRPGMDGM